MKLSTIVRVLVRIIAVAMLLIGGVLVYAGQLMGVVPILIGGLLYCILDYDLSMPKWMKRLLGK